MTITQQSFAQQKVHYQLCGHNFSPLSMRQELPPNATYRNTTASAVARAKDVLDRLSFKEKLRLTGGWNYKYFPGVPQLGLRPIYFSDASQGLHILGPNSYGRKHMKYSCISMKKSTAFPSELALAATWDPQLAYRYAKSIGEEAHAWGVSVLLGPGLNMYRNSEGGRNYEYMGEDPFLTSTMAVAYVKGLQSTGTLAALKHFIGNEQEFARHIVNVKIGECALREIYLRPFLAAINKGGAMAIMTGNNFVNGYPGAADKPISEDILRGQYDYKGIIMSDWANSTFWPRRQHLVLGSGQSLLMYNNKLFTRYIHRQIKQHSAEKDRIEKGLDRMVFHNLYTFFKAGFYDRPYRDPSLVKKIGSHKKVALRTAEEAITLLKNKGHILPIKSDKAGKIVVLGTHKALMAATGTGSGHVEGYDRTNYLTGLKHIYGNKIVRKENINDKQIKSADVVLYFINKHAGEGSDDPFALPDSINSNISRVSRLNKNVVVIYSGGNGVAMPWISRVKGLVFAYLLGQESGPALAGVISGKVNPSGKLPFTIEKSFKDSPAYDYNKMPDGKYYWCGGGGCGRKYRKKFGHIQLIYKEGPFIGYRWYEKKDIQPRFPFGFGLSYTTFKVSGIKTSSSVIGKNDPVTISFTVKNTGKREGTEVAQLYIHKINPSIDRPIKELKGFKRVFLKPGKSKTVSIPVHVRDLAFWSTKEHQWKVNLGQYLVEIGTSVADITQKIKITKH
jgi:beta-glucosidase